MLGAGHTVVYNALALLVFLGFKEIHIFGQDFCYLDYRRYAWQELSYDELSEKGPVLYESIKGKSVLTDDILLRSLDAVKRLIRDHSEIQFIIHGDGLLKDRGLSNLRSV